MSVLALNDKKEVMQGVLNSASARGHLTVAQLRKHYGSALTNQGKQRKIAMDSALAAQGHFAALQRLDGVGNLFNSFLGYAYLSVLEQNGFIKAGVEGLADDMTESWIELSRVASAEYDEDEKIVELNNAIDKFDLRTLFNTAAKYCGYFGGCLIYVDTGDEGKDLAVEIDGKSLKGGIKGFVPIEPINITPGQYNSSDALKADYFKPKTWFVLGKEVHESRLLYFTAGELGVLLKPSYNFFGVPSAQIALDAVRKFTDNYDSASRLLDKFSLTYLKTDMGSVMYSGNPEMLKARVKLIAETRDNDSIVVIDKEDEDFGQINTSLGEVSNLVKTALEQLPIMFRMPATKFLGISPGGLNSTGESDENMWNNYVLSQSKKIFKAPLKKALDYIQYHLWGEVDPDIKFEFSVRGSKDALNQATINQVKATVGQGYVDRGILSPAEERKRIAEDPTSGYNFIDVDEVPEQSALEDDMAQYEDMLSADEDKFDPFELDDYVLVFDSDFDESKVNRASNGQFGSGGSSEGNDAPKAFGTKIEGYKGDVNGAIDRLLEDKQGYIDDAVNIKGIGNVSLVYGEPGVSNSSRGFGLSHIVRRRNEEGLDGEKFAKETMPEILKNGRLYSKIGHPGRVYIGTGKGKDEPFNKKNIEDKEIAIRFDYDGITHNWVISSYVINEK